MHLFSRDAWAGICTIAVVACVGGRVEAYTSTEALMALPGKMAAPNSGAFQYEIDLPIPRGSAGMFPYLQLSYDSLERGDLLGPGWSLSGLHTIERCPLPGDVAGHAESFCLDGERLVAVHGAYGADGTQYRTEIDSFTRVTSYGGAVGRPEWFEARFKKGLVLEFGHSQDSREADSSRIVRWRENKGSDTVGTYYSILYAPDTREGTVHPVRIDYSGNDAAGLKPYNAITFVYSGAPAIGDGGRYPARADVQLREINIAVEGSAAAAYRLDYMPDGHLQSIKRCDGQEHCLVPVMFSWQEVGKPRYGAVGNSVVLLSSVSNGLGATDKFAYTAAPAPTAQATRPQGSVDAGYPDYVAARFDGDNGIGGRYETLYSFRDGRIDRAGHGFLGFGNVDSSDPQTGEVIKHEFGRDWPAKDCVLLSTTAYGSTTTERISRDCESLTTAPGVIYPYIAKETKQRWDLDGTLLPTETMVDRYDSFGGNSYDEVTWSDGWKKTTENEYWNDPDKWFISRLTKTTVHVDTPDSHMMRAASFQYRLSDGVLTQEVIEPDLPAYRLQTDYEIDPLGERIVATVSGNGIETRSRRKEFDGTRRFNISETDALGAREQWKYDPVSGYLISHEWPDGRHESWKLDGFGRLLHGVALTGQDGDFSYDYCAGIGGGTAGCPAGATFLIKEIPYSSSVGREVVNYFDALSRPLGGETTLSNGDVIKNEIRYDALKHEAERCDPNDKRDGTEVCQATQYDAMGRIVSGTLNGQLAYTRTYRGLTNINTSTLGNSKQVTVDARGREIEEVIDGKKTTRYAYDAYGNELQETEPNGKVTAMTYNQRGDMITRTTADGTWRYEYNVLGEMTRMTDPHESTQKIKPSRTRTGPTEVRGGGVF